MPAQSNFQLMRNVPLAPQFALGHLQKHCKVDDFHCKFCFLGEAFLQSNYCGARQIALRVAQETG
jgi:hypothetical protein